MRNAVRSTTFLIAMIFGIDACSSNSWAEEEGVFAVRRNVLRGQGLGDTDRILVSDPLYYELGRQALLMTAREEFGLTTRDDSLYEEVERDAPETFNAVLEVVTKKGGDLRLYRGKKRLWKGHLTDVNGPVKTYHALCEALEPLISEDFVTLLEELGYKYAPAKWKSTAPLTPQQEAMLLAMNHIAQWQALRSIHSDIRTDGESPERLAGLVRGYANLAQLTLPLLDLRHQVYRARALLYGQRLENRVDGKPFGVWHQQYAWIMCGLIRSSNQAFKQFDKLEPTEETPPAWLELLRFYGVYDFDKLETLAFKDPNAPTRELAQLLWFRARQQSICKNMVIQDGRRLLQEGTHSLWVQDALYELSGVGFKHYLTAIAPRMHARQIAVWLPEAVDQPLGVSIPTLEQDEPPGMLELDEIAQALIDVGKIDRREPSLANLGHTIRGWNVLHIMRRGRFVRHSLGMDAASEIEPYYSLLEKHPLGAFVTTLALPRAAKAEQYDDYLEDVEFIDGCRRTFYHLLRAIPEDTRLANMSVKEAVSKVWLSSSDCEMDVAWTMMNFYGNNSTSQLHSNWKLTQNTWHSPLRFYTMVRHDWKKSKEKLEKIKKNGGHFPSVQYAIALGYESDKEYEKAIEFYEQFLEVAPLTTALRSLANIYYQQGDDEKWLSTMKRIFELEDYGLEHSYAANSVAATLMHQGKFEEALPWAARGAASGAARPMINHAECLTALGAYQEAEEIVKYVSERYGGSYSHGVWYDWCARTGAGGLFDAWADRLAWMDANLKPSSRDYVVPETIYYLIADDLEHARDMLEFRLSKKFSPWDSMTYWLVLDQLGETEQRDAAWATIKNHNYLDGNDDVPYYKNLCEYFQRVLEGEKLQKAEIDRVVAGVDVNKHGKWESTLYFLTGWFLANRGEEQQAIDYWKPGARIYVANSWLRILSWKRLRDAGEDPALVEQRYFSGQFYREEPVDKDDAPEKQDSDGEEAESATDDEPVAEKKE